MRRLTAREIEICDLLIKGLSNKQIGRQLGISHRTVEDHKYEIKRRIGSHNVLALAREVAMNDPRQPCPCCGRMEAAVD